LITQTGPFQNFSLQFSATPLRMKTVRGSSHAELG
jgi:hypothetical protein